MDLFDKLESPDTDNEEENILNKCRGQKRRRLVLSSESETDVENRRIETAVDATFKCRKYY